MTPSRHQPLRIALLTYSTKPRGSVVHTLELAIALHHQGHQVCVFALDKDGQGFGRSLPCPVELIPTQPAPKPMDQLIYQRIQEFVVGLTQHHTSAEPYDVYHAQDCLSANALLLSRQDVQQTWAIAPIIRTVHHIEQYNSPYLHECQDRSIREADLCLCVSHHWQQQLQSHYGIDAPRVINGIDPQRFTAELDGSEAQLQQRLGLRADSADSVFLTVGGIEPRKNSIGLLQAFAQVRQTCPQSQLVIAGGATLFDYQAYRDDFFAEAERLQIPIGTALILPGVLSDADLATLYRLADALVFPSIKEGWGMVVLEAIASNLPVILSHQPPFTEFLTDDQALWVDADDVGAIAQAMLTLTDPGLCHTLAIASQPILANYTWPKSAQLHSTHYRQMLESVQ